MNGDRWEYRDMMGQRHSGDLGGRLSDARVLARVTVVLDEEYAGMPVAQHLAWMLVNLLARQSHEVRDIVLRVPADVPQVTRLSPLASGTLDLSGALRRGIARIHPEVIMPSANTGGPARSHILVRIGPGPLAVEGLKGDRPDFALATSAVGWSGYVGQAPAEILGPERHPIGAYVAAALCAGEVFKFVRAMRPDAGAFARCLWLDAYTLRISTTVPTETASALEDPLQGIPAVLAGVGAVANGFLHTLYAVPTYAGRLTAIDYDPKGITETNLNRYVLFGHGQIGAKKASTAARLLKRKGLTLLPVDESWQEWWNTWSAAHPDAVLPLVISAVDKNSARHAIQDALPQLILGASTNEMRAQVNRYDPGRGDPCLRCWNLLEPAIPDAAIIAHLHSLDPVARAAAAMEHGISPGVLETYLADPAANCGILSGPTLQQFAAQADDDDASGEWAVGFVSLLAGVLLAAEYLKVSLPSEHPGFDVEHNLFRFQFWRPESAEANTTTYLPPERACICQSPFYRHLAAHVSAM